MKRSTCLFAALGAIAILVGPARAIDTIQHDQPNRTTFPRWNVVDISFALDAVPDDPTAAEFSVTFQHADSGSIQVEGFYNGGNRYAVRFTPPKVGVWKYSTTSSLAKLDGLSGSLTAAVAPIGRKGGVVVDPKTPTQFRYENGDVYYPIAFESDWLFALDAENENDIPRTRALVDTLAENGFNQVVMNVFAYDVKWEKDDRLDSRYDYGSPRVFPFGGNNTDPDYSKLNVDYFKRLDRVIDYLDQKGIVAHLMIYVWNKRVSWPDANSNADNRYFDYVVKRYQAFPNLIWDVSKEALGYGHTDVHYISDRIKRLRDLDRYNRLVTVHDYGYCRRFQDNVDFISVQLWSSELHSVMRKVCADMPGKPILNIEHGGYEKGPYVVFTGNYTSPEVCLERAYQCVFAGTFPTHYWQGAAWNVVVPKIDALAPEDRPRLDYYRHLRTLVDRYNLSELKAGDKKSNAGFCLHNGQELFLYYVPKECEYIGVRLPKEAKGKRMTGTWFNPFTGGMSEPQEMEIEQWPAFAKPQGDGFRVLIVKIQP